ncbi:MAG: hypothetical protein ACOYNS_06280 [Bacteroidota bacterium]
MLTVGFLVLLTFAVVSINKMVVDKDKSFYEKEVIKQSGTLADALFEEIATKRFDEKADTAFVGIQDSLSFASPLNLGLDWSYWYLINNGTTWKLGADERGTVSLPDIVNTRNRFRSFSNADDRYDDIDDYKGYIRTADSGPFTGFSLWSTVEYINYNFSTNTYTVSALKQTHYKRVTVYVTNTKYLQDTLSYYRIFSF